ncbi:MAG: PQQ-binding-like beta-propeller repeat protein [Armatimonadota bacterium]
MSIKLPAEAFVSGGFFDERLRFTALHDRGALRVSVTSTEPWLSLVPQSFGLAAGETLDAEVVVDVAAAKRMVEGGRPPLGELQIAYTQQNTAGVRVERSSTLSVQLPVAVCPTCKRVLHIPSHLGAKPPTVCMHCFERLRPCPQCGVLNTWRVRTCLVSSKHIIRASDDWVTLGGNSAHTGNADAPLGAGALIWQFPLTLHTNPLRRMQWSSLVTAFGVVYAASTTGDGEHLLHAFDVESGTPIWDPYALPAPVHPDRGGVCVVGDLVVAGLVSGSVVAVDAIRGTRRWKVDIGGSVYGSVIPLDLSAVAVPVADGVHSGRLVVLTTDGGRIKFEVPLSGRPECTPAAGENAIVVHDDTGGVLAIDASTGDTNWYTQLADSFDAAPVISKGVVYSGGHDGILRSLNLSDGRLLWQSPVLGGAITGTPSIADSVIAVPTVEGLCLVSRETGQPVQRTSRGPVRAQPIVAPDGFLFAGRDARLHRLAAGMAVDDVYDAGGGGPQVSVPMAYADGNVFVATTRGVLYALRMTGVL